MIISVLPKVRTDDEMIETIPGASIRPDNGRDEPPRIGSLVPGSQVLFPRVFPTNLEQEIRRIAMGNKKWYLYPVRGPGTVRRLAPQCDGFVLTHKRNEDPFRPAMEHVSID